jgi:hypothetical protein
MDTNRTPFVQRSQTKLYFDHKDMDYYLAWIVGRALYEGSDPVECFDVAARIINGDAASWQREWLALAQRVEAQAQTALNRGELEAARRLYLRACTYYRAPLFLMKRQAAAFESQQQQMQLCFQKAAALFDPPIETIHVPLEGHLLSGYLWKVDAY